MKIIFDKDGRCAVLIPAQEFLNSLGAGMTLEAKMVHVANKDLPTGTKYEIVESVPSDRTFRGAWEYQAGEAEKVSEDLSVLFKLKYGHDLSASEKSEVEDFLAVKAEEKRKQAEKAEAAEAKRLAKEEENRKRIEAEEKAKAAEAQRLLDKEVVPANAVGE